MQQMGKTHSISSLVRTTWAIKKRTQLTRVLSDDVAFRAVIKYCDRDIYCERARSIVHFDWAHKAREISLHIIVDAIYIYYIYMYLRLR